MSVKKVIKFFRFRKGYKGADSTSWVKDVVFYESDFTNWFMETACKVFEMKYLRPIFFALGWLAGMVLLIIFIPIAFIFVLFTGAPKDI